MPIFLCMRPLETGRLTHNRLSTQLQDFARTEGLDTSHLGHQVTVFKREKRKERRRAARDEFMKPPQHKVLHLLDRGICGEFQIPAFKLEELSSDSRASTKLARRRVAEAVGTFLEVAGRGIATFGISGTEPHILFFGGTLLVVAGGSLRFHTRARSGAQWSQTLQETLIGLGPHKTAAMGTLVDKGISEEELRSIGGLPQSISLAEGAHPVLSRARYVLTPMGSGIGMILAGNDIVGPLLAGTGLAAIPFGERSYKKSSRRRAKLRLATSARHGRYVKRLLKDGSRQSDRLNISSYIPEGGLLFAYLANLGGNALQNVYGITQGARDFGNAMNIQNQREAARRDTEIATILINTISNKPFIATPQRWREHIAEAGVAVFSEIPFKNGIVIRDFRAQTPAGEYVKLAPITMEVPANGAAVLRAESGDGKTITLMGIMHLLEHKGSVCLVKDGEVIDVHSLSGPKDINENIVYIAKDDINEHDRVVDLFKTYFQESHMALFNEQMSRHQDKDMMEAAWTTADNLLEQEITKLKSESSGSMLHDFKKLREKRNMWVKHKLHEQGGNIADITPDRVFGTLSEGEKRRVIVAMADVATQVRKRVAVILDEPLANLDEKNKARQIEMLRRIQERQSVALIVISHDNIPALQEGLNNCQVINLE